MLLVVTNIPTPYRSAFFNALEKECQQRAIGFHVLYCAKTEPRRTWSTESLLLNHSHEFLSGFHPNLLGAYPHINLGVVQKVQKLQPQHLLIAGAWNTPTMLAAILTRSRTKTNAIFWSEGHAHANIYKSGVVPRLRRWVYSKFDAYAVPNSKSKQWALSQTNAPRPVYMLPNSIDCEWYRRKSQCERGLARERLGISPSFRLLVQIAGLENRKGTLELAHCFLAMPSSVRHNAMLAFVGGGPLESKLRELSKLSNDSICITGALQPPEVRRWLMAADAFFLNTFRDPNPLSPIEAGTAGLPIAISSLAGNVNEVVGEVGGGWIINDPNDPSAVLEKVLSLPRIELARLGDINAKHFSDLYSGDAVAKCFVQQLTDSASSK